MAVTDRTAARTAEQIDEEEEGIYLPALQQELDELRERVDRQDRQIEELRRLLAGVGALLVETA